MNLQLLFLNHRYPESACVKKRKSHEKEEVISLQAWAQCTQPSVETTHGDILHVSIPLRVMFCEHEQKYPPSYTPHLLTQLLSYSGVTTSTSHRLSPSNCGFICGGRAREATDISCDTNYQAECRWQTGSHRSPSGCWETYHVYYMSTLTGSWHILVFNIHIYTCTSTYTYQTNSKCTYTCIGYTPNDANIVGQHEYHNTAF